MNKFLFLFFIIFVFSCRDKETYYRYKVDYVVYYTQNHTDTFSVETEGFPAVISYDGTNRLVSYSGSHYSTTAPIKILKTQLISKNE